MVAFLLLSSADASVLRGLAETCKSFLNWTTLAMVLLAFGCEFIDSSLGMGYGTALTPLLILLGFEPLRIVPAVLLSELMTGLTAGVLHHGAGNVDLGKGSRARRVVLVLAACSILGAPLAVSISVHLSKQLLSALIGLLVVVIGIVILATLNKTYGFSWRKVTILGLLAAFNKAISGGGYGPLVVSGQMLSGVNAKNAVGITSVSEGLTCLVGVILYYLMPQGSGVDARLALPLVIGAMLSVPLAVSSVKVISESRLRVAVGVLTVILGLATLVKVMC